MFSFCKRTTVQKIVSSPANAKSFHFGLLYYKEYCKVVFETFDIDKNSSTEVKSQTSEETMVIFFLVAKRLLMCVNKTTENFSADFVSTCFELSV